MSPVSFFSFSAFSHGIFFSKSQVMLSHQYPPQFPWPADQQKLLEMRLLNMQEIGKNMIFFLHLLLQNIELYCRTWALTVLLLPS